MWTGKAFGPNSAQSLGGLCAASGQASGRVGCSSPHRSRISNRSRSGSSRSGQARRHHGYHRFGLHGGRLVTVSSGTPRCRSLFLAPLRRDVGPVSPICPRTGSTSLGHLDAERLGSSTVNRRLRDKASRFPGGYRHQRLHSLLAYRATRGIRDLIQTVTNGGARCCSQASAQHIIGSCADMKPNLHHGTWEEGGDRSLARL